MREMKQIEMIRQDEWSRNTLPFFSNNNEYCKELIIDKIGKYYDEWTFENIEYIEHKGNHLNIITRAVYTDNGHLIDKRQAYIWHYEWSAGHQSMYYNHYSLYNKDEVDDNYIPYECSEKFYNKVKEINKEAHAKGKYNNWLNKCKEYFVKTKHKG